MLAIHQTAIQHIAGGYFGTYGAAYEAYRARPGSPDSNSGDAGKGGERPGWNVAPAPGSNAYGSGWGEDNNGMG